MSRTISKLPTPLTLLGEGPHWDDQQQALFYVNIFEKTIHRYIPSKKLHTHSKIDSEHNVHFIIPVEGKKDTFVIGTGQQILVIKWDGQEQSAVEKLHVLATLGGGHEHNIINDAKVDAEGRLITGTIGATKKDKLTMDSLSPNGTLYSVSGSGDVRVLDTGVTCSNGIAIDTTRKLLYHVDTFQNVVRRFDYDVKTGEAKNKKIFFNFTENGLTGFPDGMTIDVDGNVWVASFGGSQVIKVSPDGNILEKLDLKVKQITSATFGGPQLDTLYVTTGSFDFVGEKPPGGELLEVKGLGVKGLKNLPFKWSPK